MVISGTTENAKRIKDANFISVSDGVAGLITDFSEEVGEKGIEYTFSGVELKGLASKRIIMPPDGEAYLTYTNKSPEYVMANLIASQLINSSDERKFNGSVAEFTEGSDKITFNGRFDALGETLANLAETYSIGWYADIQGLDIVWHIYHGKDRSISQEENNRFILSYDFDTLQESVLELTKTLPNVAVVAGQGEGTERQIAFVGESSGLDRGEVYIDARDVEDPANLPQRGQEKLAEYGDNAVFEITLSPGIINQYRKTFDLGDIGSIKTQAFSASCVLSEVTEVYEGGELMRIDTTFGYDKQTISSAIKRINSNASTLVKVEGSTGGGGTGGTTDYNALNNKPQINGFELKGNKSAADLGLAAANHKHSYSDITDKPTIPSKVSDLQNDLGFIDVSALNTALSGYASENWVGENFVHKYDAADTYATYTYVDEQIAKVSGGGEVSGHTVFYGTCTTTGATTAKTVNCADFTKLESGACIRVKFSYANTATSPTMNVNGTGAKSIKKYGTTASMGYMWYMGEVKDFVYDGTYWVMVDGGTATTTYYGVTKLRNTIANDDTTALTPGAVYDLGIDSGTWTPSVINASTYTTRQGWYQKVGNCVTVGFLVTGTWSSAASTTFEMYGLPFTCGSTMASGSGVVFNAKIGANTVFCGWVVLPNTTTIGARTYGVRTAAGGISLGTGLTTNPSNTFTISGTICYSIV